MMADKKKPDTLYKYRDWANECHQRMVTCGELYFPSTRELNDPFEAVIPICYDDGSCEDWLKVAKRQVRYKNPRLRDEWVACTARDIMKSGIYKRAETVEYHTKNSIEHMANDFGVCSLSERKDNILMWSHYANEHRGFCVGLDVQVLEESSCEILARTGNILDLRRVVYRADFPFLNGFSGDFETLVPRVINTKSLDWKYEKEWRLLLMTGRPSLKGDSLGERQIIFGEEVLSKIILGVKMPGKQREEAIDTVRSNCPHVEVIQAHRNDGSFGLTFKRL